MFVHGQELSCDQPRTCYLDQVTCDDQTVVVLVKRPNDSSVAGGCSQLFVGGGLDLQESPLDIEGIPEYFQASKD